MNPFRLPATVTAQVEDRYRKTIAILDDWDAIRPNSTALDLGPTNPLGAMIATHFGLHRVQDTGERDLDSYVGPSLWLHNFDRVDYVFAFEILEHLFNPLLAMEKALVVARPWCRVFVSVPIRPHWMQYDGHFHEFDEYRLAALFDRAGLRAVREARFRMAHSRAGVRPVLRWFAERVLLVELELVEQWRRK